MVYSISNDYSPMASGQSAAVFTEDDLEHASGLQDTFSDVRMPEGTVGVAFSVSEGEMVAVDYIRPGHAANGPARLSPRQTYTGSFDRWIGQFRNDEFCLAFPPGRGTVTLMKVALTKAGP